RSSLREWPRRARLEEVRIEVAPLGIDLLDQADLPGPVPLLHRPLAREGGLTRVEPLVVDEPGDAVSCCETWLFLVNVFPDTVHEVFGRPEVQRPVAAAGQHVDEERHR